MQTCIVFGICIQSVHAWREVYTPIVPQQCDLKDLNPAERFQCHLLNVETQLCHPAVLHADVSSFFQAATVNIYITFYRV